MACMHTVLVPSQREDPETQHVSYLQRGELLFERLGQRLEGVQEMAQTLGRHVGGDGVRRLLSAHRG